MSGFDCVDMLGQICPDAKFFLAANQYSLTEERRAIQLPRTRYVCNMTYREILEEHGLKFSGLSPDGLLPEIVEITDHPWYVGVQFHPESI